MSDTVAQLIQEEPLLLPLLPLRDIVVFPYMVAPLFVGRAQSIEAIETAYDGDKYIFLASQRDRSLILQLVMIKKCKS